MLGAPRNPPRVVTVRVNKASGLRNTYVEAKKHRKDNCKWKVKIKGGKKTMESYTINDPSGNPTWDFEATVEIVDISQPVVIKVTDSDDHHVGQVVIPLVQIPPRPAGPSAKPATSANLRVAELEPTKKVSEVYGSLYYWIWAESYYDDFGPEKSSGTSIIGSNRIRRSASRLSSHLHRHRDKDDGASVAESSLSMYSTASGKKKHWYQKNPIKHIQDKHRSGAAHLGSKHGSELGYSMSQSMNSLFPSENDGSILGGRSGNGSYISAGSNAVLTDVDSEMPTAEDPFPRVGSSHLMARPPSLARKIANNPDTALKRPTIPSERPKRRSEYETPLKQTEKTPSPASSDEGDDIQTQPPSALEAPLSTQEPPSLLSISPSTGSLNSETEVRVYGKNLSPSIMRHAVLLVDDYTVANYNWSVSEGSWTEEPRATHRLTLKVPPKKDASDSNEVWIDVETMGHGRLRCPTPFVYHVSEKPPKEKQPSSNLLESGFIRNSSIRLSDNRARRSVRRPAETTPLKATSPLTTEKSGFARNSSIRLSDTRVRRSMRGAKPPPPTLPSFNEIPSGAGTRSSGLGSEDSFSETTAPGATICSIDELNPPQERTKVTLPTILKSKNDHSLRTVPDKKTLEVSSDFDDNSSPQLQPSPSSGMKDDNETKGARSPIPVLTEHQKSQSPGSTVIMSPLESDFYSAAKIEEKKPKTSSPTSIEPKASPPRSRSPSPVVTGPYYEDDFYLSTLKEVEKPRTPSLVITQTQKSRSPSPIAIKPQNGSEYQASPFKESSNAGSVVDSTHVTSRYHSDEESSRSSSPAEINTKKRPDPIGGIVTVPSQQYDEEKAKTVLREGEEATLESGDSTDYSLDSACGDSLLPTMDENSYLRSQVHPRFVLMEPSKGSTVGDYEVCLYGVHLDKAVMLHAQVFIDVYNVPKENWRVVPGQWPSLAPDATHCLLIRVPPMPPGEAWIEVETLNDGRLQCPRPFVFTDNFLMKHSMRGMGGQVDAASPPTIRKPASSFADFELSPKEKVAKLHAKNNKDIDSARLEISKLYNEIMHLKVELQAKSADEVRVARELCILQNRLLEDGHLKYLERD